MESYYYLMIYIIKHKILLFIQFISIFIILTSSSLSSTQILNDDIFLEKFEPNSFVFNNIYEDDKQLKILYPLMSIPELVEKDDQIKIDFESDEFDNIFAVITTAFEPVEDKIWLDLKSVSYKDHYWESLFLIPEDSPPELYNLTVIVQKDGKFYSDSCPNSLAIYDEIGDDFTIAHVADFHVGDPRGFLESVNETLDFKSIKRCISEINLMNPDMVLISGDLVFGQLYPFEYSLEYKKCYEILQLFDVPTFIVPGNHDGYYRFREDGMEFWKEYFGPLFYSFDFGNYHFVGINSFDWPPILRLSVLFIALNWGGSIQEEQLNWIEQDLKESNANLTFMFMHHNPIWETKNNSLLRMGYKNRQRLLGIIYENNVNMVLAGHVHVDTVNEENNTIFITTTTPESEIRKQDGYWGYRLIEIRDGSIFSYNYKEPKYSIPTYKLKCEYMDIYNAKITNELEMDVNILLKFSVPIGNYLPSIGDITLVRNNEYMQQVYVEANIAEKSVTNVFLTPI